MKQVRCAIYARKSSDEGLEQSFNSLDAQREACAAYILSQASEGWLALPTLYDDGGLSGGTLQRPALQRLLADVAAGRIDIIVVYKVDRLTRSLFDFAKLVELLDKASTSFVSVTQSFNTTTSMGRLTLNMLLSFAQFEREVTAERIRDKIAASKAKGMWMGGTPPLGYAPDGRSLAIVEPEAALVRTIFARYLALGNVRMLCDELASQKVGAPRRTTRTGRSVGGVPFTRGQIYAMLSCPTYVGEIHHRGRNYPGLHQPIIDRICWDEVQKLLAANRQGHRNGARAASPSLLAGKLVDANDQPLVASHATEGATRYRYYVSRDRQKGDSQQGWRIPARELETVVTAAISKQLADPIALMSAGWLAVAPGEVAAFAARCGQIDLRPTAEHRVTIGKLIEGVRIYDSRIEISCSTEALAELLKVVRDPGAPGTITLVADVRLTRTGRAMRLIQGDGLTSTTAPNPSLLKLLVKAQRWWAIIRTGDIDIQTLAKREGVQAAYVTRVLRLAFLSPAVVEAMLVGRTQASLDAAAVTATGAISPLWPEQVARMLPAIATRPRAP